MAVESDSAGIDMRAKHACHVSAGAEKPEGPNPHDVFHMILHLGLHASLSLHSDPHQAELKKSLEYLTFIYGKNDGTLAQAVESYSGACYGPRDGLLLLLKLVYLAPASVTSPLLMPLFEVVFAALAKDASHLSEATHFLKSWLRLLVKGEMSAQHVALPLCVLLFRELQNPFLGEGLPPELIFKNIEELDRFEDFVLQLAYSLIRKITLVKAHVLPLFSAVVKFKVYQGRRFSEFYLDAFLGIAELQALHFTRPLLCHLCRACFKSLALRPLSHPFSAVRACLGKLETLLEALSAQTMLMQSIAITELPYLKWLKSPLGTEDKRWLVGWITKHLYLLVLPHKQALYDVVDWAIRLECPTPAFKALVHGLILAAGPRHPTHEPCAEAKAFALQTDDVYSLIAPRVSARQLGTMDTVHLGYLEAVFMCLARSDSSSERTRSLFANFFKSILEAMHHEQLFSNALLLGSTIRILDASCCIEFTAAQATSDRKQVLSDILTQLYRWQWPEKSDAQAQASLADWLQGWDQAFASMACCPKLASQTRLSLLVRGLPLLRHWRLSSLGGLTPYAACVMLAYKSCADNAAVLRMLVLLFAQDAERERSLARVVRHLADLCGHLEEHHEHSVQRTSVLVYLVAMLDACNVLCYQTDASFSWAPAPAGYQVVLNFGALPVRKFSELAKKLQPSINEAISLAIQAYCRLLKRAPGADNASFLTALGRAIQSGVNLRHLLADFRQLFQYAGDDTRLALANALPTLVAPWIVGPALLEQNHGSLLSLLISLKSNDLAIGMAGMAGCLCVEEALMSFICFLLDYIDAQGPSSDPPPALLALKELHRIGEARVGSTSVLVATILPDILDTLGTGLVTRPYLISQLAAVLDVSPYTLVNSNLHIIVPNLILESQFETLHRIAGALQDDVQTLAVNFMEDTIALFFLNFPYDDAIARLQEALGSLFPAEFISIEDLFPSCANGIFSKLMKKLVYCYPSGRDEKLVECAKALACKLYQKQAKKRPFAVLSDKEDANGKLLSAFAQNSALGILNFLKRFVVESLEPWVPSQRKVNSLRCVELLSTMLGSSVGSFQSQLWSLLDTAYSTPALRHTVLSIMLKLLLSGTVFSAFSKPILVKYLLKMIDSDAKLHPDYPAALAKLLAHLSLSPCFVELLRRSPFKHHLELAPFFASTQTHAAVDFASFGGFLSDLLADQNDPSFLRFVLDILYSKLIESPLQIEQMNNHMLPLTGDAMIKPLIAISRQYTDSRYAEVAQLSIGCLALLIDTFGADSLKQHTSIASQADAIWLLSDRSTSLSFAFNLIVSHLIPAFKSSKEADAQDLIAFALQELLKMDLAPRAGLSSSQDNPVTGSDSDIQSSQAVGCFFPLFQVEDMLSKEAGLEWQLLAEEKKEFLKPFLRSKYRYRNFCTLPYREPHGEWDLCYQPGMSLAEWLRAYMKALAMCVKDPWMRHLFSICLAASSVDINATLTIVSFLLAFLVFSSHGESTPCFFVKEMSIVIATVGLSEELYRAFHRIMSHVFAVAASLGKTKKVAPDTVVALMDLFRDSFPSHALANMAHSFSDFETAILFQEKFIHEASLSAGSVLERSLLCIQESEMALGNVDQVLGNSMLFKSFNINNQILVAESKQDYEKAISCYQLSLQKNPGDRAMSSKLLRCLESSGQFDVLYCYAMQFSDQHPQATQNAERYHTACWKLGRWDDFSRSQDASHRSFSSIAGALIGAMHRDAGAFATDSDPFESQLVAAKHALMTELCSVNADAEEAYRKLKLLKQFELLKIDLRYHVLGTGRLASLANILVSKLESTHFSTSDDLSIQALRAFYRIFPELGTPLRLATHLCKLARYHRKTMGHASEAFKTIIEASECANQLSEPADARAHCIEYLVTLEKAKLLWSSGSLKEAMELVGSCPLVAADSLETDSDAALSLLSMASKARRQLAEWMIESRQRHPKEVLAVFEEAIKLKPKSEKVYYQLARFQLELHTHALGKDSEILVQLVKNLARAILFGSKYIKETLPKFLSIWFDAANFAEGDSEGSITFGRIHRVVEKLTEQISAAKLMTCSSQIISRICHPTLPVFALLQTMLLKMMSDFSHQTLWCLIAVSKSTISIRAKRCGELFNRCKSLAGQRSNLKDMVSFSDQLILLANHACTPTQTTLSLAKDFKGLQRLFPISVAVPTRKMMLHLESATAPLPLIAGLEDRVDVMSSLQKPKKLTMLGTDGLSYDFLCKPKDDLRKDARFMEYVSLINKLLAENMETKRRSLHLRPYAVFPINEETGLIEWVPHTVGYRQILLKIYERKKLATSNRQLREIIAMKLPPKEIFLKHLLPRYPAVFQEWFFHAFPLPRSWYQSRLAYTRTCAVISVVGYIIGLGDRHGENILFDSTNGDTVHVDFNCLFDKGLTFEKPERVPFRLTHNMVDAFGLAGYEGAFRKSCELTLKIMRENKDMLLHILETFAYDPLLEWSKSRKTTNAHGEIDSEEARKTLSAIERKLTGMPSPQARLPLSVEGQVDDLIREATSIDNLALMYVGWAPYM